MERNGYECDACKTFACKQHWENSGETLPFGWVELPTKVGTEYNRDLVGNTLHICPECVGNIDISVGSTTLVSGMADISPNWVAMYQKAVF